VDKMKDEQVKEMFYLWKTSNRLSLIAGAVAFGMLLGLSFIRPYVDSLLYLLYFPGVLYAVFYACKMNKISRKVNRVKDSLKTESDKSDNAA